MFPTLLQVEKKRMSFVVFSFSSIYFWAGDHIQYWAKPQPNDSVAILIINNNFLWHYDADVDLSLVNLTCSSWQPCSVHDIWLEKDFPVFGSTCASIHPFNELVSTSHFIHRLKTGNIPPHDSKFYIVSPTNWFDCHSALLFVGCSLYLCESLLHTSSTFPYFAPWKLPVAVN